MLNTEGYNIPDHTFEGIKNYVLDGIPPGGFLEAVFCNNLKESFGRADAKNREAIADIVRFLYNEIPHTCWGSPGRVKNWLQIKREEREKNGLENITT